MAGRICAVVLFGAPLVISALGPAASAGADPSGNAGGQIGSTKQQISALQGQVSTASSKIHDLALAYDQASLQAQILGQQVSADEVRIAQLRDQVSSDQDALRREAILSYTGQTATSPGAVRAGTDPSIRAEYLQVATGDMTQTVDEYRIQQAQLSSAATNLERQELASRAAADQVSIARAAALRQAEAEQAQLTSLETKLGNLEAAAAKATQGLPVNGGIVTVVHALVSGNSGDVWLKLRECESSDNYQANTGNGFYGAYQFSQSTWTNLGYPGRPDLESPAMQDAAAQKDQAEYGWGQWPQCSAALGLS